MYIKCKYAQYSTRSKKKSLSVKFFLLLLLYFKVKQNYFVMRNASLKPATVCNSSTKQYFFSFLNSCTYIESHFLSFLPPAICSVSSNQSIFTYVLFCMVALHSHALLLWLILAYIWWPFFSLLCYARCSLCVCFIKRFFFIYIMFLYISSSLSLVMYFRIGCFSSSTAAAIVDCVVVWWYIASKRIWHFFFCFHLKRKKNSWIECVSEHLWAKYHFICSVLCKGSFSSFFRSLY